MAVFPYLDYEKMTASERKTPEHDTDADDHALDTPQDIDNEHEDDESHDAGAGDDTLE